MGSVRFVVTVTAVLALPGTFQSTVTGVFGCDVTVWEHDLGMP